MKAFKTRVLTFMHAILILGLGFMLSCAEPIEVENSELEAVITLNDLQQNSIHLGEYLRNESKPLVFPIKIVNPSPSHILRDINITFVDFLNKDFRFLKNAKNDSVFPGFGGTCERNLKPNSECTIVLAFTSKTKGLVEQSIKIDYKTHSGSKTNTIKLSVFSGNRATLGFLDGTSRFSFGNSIRGDNVLERSIKRDYVKTLRFTNLDEFNLTARNLNIGFSNLSCIDKFNNPCTSSETNKAFKLQNFRCEEELGSMQALEIGDSFNLKGNHSCEVDVHFDQQNRVDSDGVELLEERYKKFTYSAKVRVSFEEDNFESKSNLTARFSLISASIEADLQPSTDSLAFEERLVVGMRNTDSLISSKVEVGFSNEGYGQGFLRIFYVYATDSDDILYTCTKAITGNILNCRDTGDSDGDTDVDEVVGLDRLPFFVVDNNSCLAFEPSQGKRIQPGESCKFEIRFQPSITKEAEEDVAFDYRLEFDSLWKNLETITLHENIDFSVSGGYKPRAKVNIFNVSFDEVDFDENDANGDGLGYTDQSINGAHYRFYDFGRIAIESQAYHQHKDISIQIKNEAANGNSAKMVHTKDGRDTLLAHVPDDDLVMVNDNLGGSASHTSGSFYYFKDLFVNTSCKTIIQQGTCSMTLPFSPILRTSNADNETAMHASMFDYYLDPTQSAPPSTSIVNYSPHNYKSFVFTYETGSCYLDSNLTGDTCDEEVSIASTTINFKAVLALAGKLSEPEYVETLENKIPSISNPKEFRREEYATIFYRLRNIGTKEINYMTPCFGNYPACELNDNFQVKVAGVYKDIDDPSLDFVNADLGESPKLSSAVGELTVLPEAESKISDFEFPNSPATPKEAWRTSSVSGWSNDLKNTADDFDCSALIDWDGQMRNVSSGGDIISFPAGASCILELKYNLTNKDRNQNISDEDYILYPLNFNLFSQTELSDYHNFFHYPLQGGGVIDIGNFQVIYYNGDTEGVSPNPSDPHDYSDPNNIPSNLPSLYDAGLGHRRQSPPFDLENIEIKRAPSLQVDLANDFPSSTLFKCGLERDPLVVNTHTTFDEDILPYWFFKIGTETVNREPFSGSDLNLFYAESSGTADLRKSHLALKQADPIDCSSQIFEAVIDLGSFPELNKKYSIPMKLSHYNFIDGIFIKDLHIEGNENCDVDSFTQSFCMTRVENEQTGGEFSFELFFKPNAYGTTYEETLYNIIDTGVDLRDSPTEPPSAIQRLQRDPGDSDNHHLIYRVKLVAHSPPTGFSPPSFDVKEFVLNSAEDDKELPDSSVAATPLNSTDFFGEVDSANNPIPPDTTVFQAVEIGSGACSTGTAFAKKRIVFRNNGSINLEKINFYLKTSETIESGTLLADASTNLFSSSSCISISGTCMSQDFTLDASVANAAIYGEDVDECYLDVKFNPYQSTSDENEYILTAQYLINGGEDGSGLPDPFQHYFMENIELSFIKETPAEISVIGQSEQSIDGIGGAQGYVFTLDQRELSNTNLEEGNALVTLIIPVTNTNTTTKASFLPAVPTVPVFDEDGWAVVATKNHDLTSSERIKVEANKYCHFGADPEVNTENTGFYLVGCDLKVTFTYNINDVGKKITKNTNSAENNYIKLEYMNYKRERDGELYLFFATDILPDKSEQSGTFTNISANDDKEINFTIPNITNDDAVNLGGIGVDHIVEYRLYYSDQKNKFDNINYLIDQSNYGNYIEIDSLGDIEISTTQIPTLFLGKTYYFKMVTVRENPLYHSDNDIFHDASNNQYLSESNAAPTRIVLPFADHEFFYNGTTPVLVKKAVESTPPSTFLESTSTCAQLGQAYYNDGTTKSSQGSYQLINQSIWEIIRNNPPYSVVPYNGSLGLLKTPHWLSDSSITDAPSFVSFMNVPGLDLTDESEDFTSEKKYYDLIEAGDYTNLRIIAGGIYLRPYEDFLSVVKHSSPKYRGQARCFVDVSP